MIDQQREAFTNSGGVRDWLPLKCSSNFCRVLSGLRCQTTSRSEVVAGTLGSTTQTRTWNLMIDLVAQSGRYPPNAAALKDFLVERREALLAACRDRSVYRAGHRSAARSCLRVGPSGTWETGNRRPETESGSWILAGKPLSWVPGFLISNSGSGVGMNNPGATDDTDETPIRKFRIEPGLIGSRDHKTDSGHV